MISSTVEDLAQERSAVDTAIRDFRFERFRSESMGSLSRSPEQVCDEMAMECDLFILIIGEKYGWIIPHLDISVTELEFDVARKDNPGKILVYEKSLNSNARELPADRLLKKATDFTTGYFRAAPFENTTELVKRVKDDIAIWISSQIRSGHLSPSKVFSLPTSSELFTQYTFVLLSILALSVLAIVGGSLFESWKYSLPNIIAIIQTSKDFYSQLAVAVLSTNGTSFFAWVMSVAIASSMMLFSMMVFKEKHASFLKLLSILGMLISIVAFTLGHMFFVFDSFSSVVIKAILPALTANLMASANEASNMESKGESFIINNEFSQLIKNVVLSAALPNSYIVAFLAVFFNEMFFGASTGLGYLVQQGNNLFIIEMSYIAIFASALSVATIYYFIKLNQSNYAWSQIIAPAIYSKIDRYPKL